MFDFREKGPGGWYCRPVRDGGQQFVWAPGSDSEVSHRSATLDERCTVWPWSKPWQCRASALRLRRSSCCCGRECDSPGHGNRDQRSNDWCASGLLHLSSYISCCATTAVAQNVLLRLRVDLLLPAWTSTMMINRGWVVASASCTSLLA